MDHSAAETAVLVIDMQNDFCSTDGALARLGSDVSANSSLSSRLTPFINGAREAGSLIVWVRQCARRELISPVRLARSKKMGHRPLEVAAENSWGAELAEGLVPHSDDVEIQKSLYSAFVGTPLNNLLRSHGRPHLVVCGTAANVCVDSTVRDAYFAEYFVSLPRDLVGWTRDELASSAIRNLGIYFCDVVDSTHLLESLRSTAVAKGSQP